MTRRIVGLVVVWLGCTEATPAIEREYDPVAATPRDGATSATAPSTVDAGVSGDAGLKAEAIADASAYDDAENDGSAPDRTDTDDSATAQEGGAPHDSAVGPCSVMPTTVECTPGKRRYRYERELGSCLALEYRECLAGTPSYPTIASCESACAVQPPAQPCSIDVADSGLSGVRVHIEGDRCNFRVGQAGVFRYRVELSESLPYRVEASRSCGFCGQFGSDASELVRTYVYGGTSDLLYCPTCDLGCCGANQRADHELTAGVTSGETYWAGRAWNGPSHTSQPLGRTFPAGRYDLQIQLVVPGAGTAIGKLPVTIE